MYKILIPFFTLILFASCGNKDKAPTTSTPATSMVSDAKEDITTNPIYIKGMELIGKNDCLTCHKVDEKLIGPTYKEVANKYADQPEAYKMLAEKIMKGGTGVWGQVPMLAHPNITQEDAEALAKYVLLLKD